VLRAAVAESDWKIFNKPGKIQKAFAVTARETANRLLRDCDCLTDIDVKKEVDGEKEEVWAGLKMDTS
jgi:hypothetical protein